MISATLKSSGVDASKVSMGNVWNKVARGIVNALRGTKGFHPAAGADKKFENKLQQVETAYRRYVLAACESALTTLKLATPKDTGKTSANWTMELRETPAGFEADLNHPNKELVERLNSGGGDFYIFPKHAKVLAFTWHGKQIFARFVHRRAQPALGFIEKAQGQLVNDIANLNKAVTG